MTADLAARLREEAGQPRRQRADWTLLSEAADAIESLTTERDRLQARVENTAPYIKRSQEAEARLAAADHEVELERESHVECSKRLAAAERLVEAVRRDDHDRHECEHTYAIRSALEAYEKAYSDEEVGFTGDPQAPPELMKQVQRATEGGPYPADLNVSGSEVNCPDECPCRSLVMEDSGPRIIRGHPPGHLAVMRGAIREARRIDMPWSGVVCQRCDCMETVVIGGTRLSVVTPSQDLRPLHERGLAVHIVDGDVTLGGPKATDPDSGEQK